MIGDIVTFLLSNPGYLLYLLLWHIWSPSQDIVLWILHKLSVINMDNRHSPVRVYKVLVRRKFVDVDMSSPKNFLSVYAGNASLDCLRARTISIYCVHDEHVYFVDTDPAVNVHSSDASAFVYIAQWKHAQRLLAVPIKDFLRFARGLEEPQVKVMLLSNTGRCGSTLLTQMLEATGYVLSVSEPDMLTGLVIYQSKKSHSDVQIGEMLDAMFRVYASMAQHHGDYKAVVLKPRSMCMNLVPLIHKHTPWVQQLYMYRQGLKTVTSMFSAFIDVPGVRAAVNDRKKALSMAKVLGLDLRGPIDKIQDFISVVTLMWATSLADFQDFRFQHKIPIYSVRYEDLLKKPREHLEAINSQYFFGLSENQILQGLQGMQKNSQRNISIGKNNNKKVKDGFDEVFTPDRRLNCAEICKAMEVPCLDSDESIPGALPI